MADTPADKSKGSSSSDGRVDNRGPSDAKKAADAGTTKRTYATIDLTASEVVIKDGREGAPKTAETAASVGATGKSAAESTVEVKTGAGSTVKVDEAGVAITTASKPTVAGKDVKSATPETKIGPQVTNAEHRRPAASTASGSSGPDASGSGFGTANAKTGKSPSTGTDHATAAQSGTGFRSFLSHAVAGVIGAALTLFGATQFIPGLGLSGSAVSNGSAGLQAELSQRLAAVEQAQRSRGTGGGAIDQGARVEALEGQVAKYADLDRRLAAATEAQAKLTADTKALDAKIGQAAPPETGPRIARLEEQLGAIASAAGDPQRAGAVPQLARITGKLADLETAITARTSSLRKDVAQDVEARVASIADASEAAKVGTARIDRELSTMKADAARTQQRMDLIKASADKIEQTVRQVQDETGAAKAALETVKTDLGQRAKPADVATALAPVASRVASIEQNLQGVVKSEQERNTTAEKIVLSLELANLKRALDRGGKFESELAAVKKLAGDRLDLSAIEAARTSGVSTLADLTGEFRRLADAMLDIDAQPENAGVMDRMMQGAKSIVRIRKINHAPDDTTTEARIGRMEMALKENRLPDVLAEMKKLPERVVPPAAAWTRKVEARAAIDAAIARSEAMLKTTLAGGDTAKGDK